MIGILRHPRQSDPGPQAVRLFDDAGCDLVVHAGDFVAPSRSRSCEPRVPSGVFGNCDGEKAGWPGPSKGSGRSEAP